MNLIKNLFTLSSKILNENFIQSRSTHYQATSLWRSVLSVSSAGAKKGRGRRRGASKMKNLNMGQELGEGKLKTEWPGLNAMVIKDRQHADIKVLGVDEYREQRLTELRNSMDKFRRLSVSSSERGWTGTSLGGKSLGEPLPLNEIEFKGFDTRIIEYKVVSTVTSILGKKRTASCFVVTGNKDGLIGIGLGKGANAAAAMRLAKSNASRKLITIKLFEDRTLFHDFYQEYYYTRVFAAKMPSGYGLRCHRIIKTICELAGVKDLYVKVDGKTNPKNVAKAFIMGLIKQKKYEDIANAKKLHVVEFRPDMNYFPKVLASPTITDKDEMPQKISDHEFELFLLNNKYRAHPVKQKPFYSEYKSYKLYLSKLRKRTIQANCRIERLAQMSDENLLKISYPRKYKIKKEKVKTEDAAAE